MNLNKKFDYSDPKNFYTDKYTIGRVEYWENKVKRLPDAYYKLLEVHSREEYDEDDIENVKESIMVENKNYHEQIMKEFGERENGMYEEQIEKTKEETKQLEDYYKENPNITFSPM